MTPQREHAQPALTADEHLLAQLPVALLVIDGAGEISFANPVATDMLAPVDLVGTPLQDLFPSLGDARGAESRTAMPDGRVLQFARRPLEGGGEMVALSDVTVCARDAQQASQDVLTGLNNRAGIQGRLSELVARARRRGGSIAVLLIDLDRFKLVNDTLGHPVGDALLIKVAARLRSVVRDGDVLARLGGDEFAILQIDENQPQAAEALAARLVDLIGRTYVIEGHMLNIGASVGIAVAPQDGDDPDTLFKRVDLALYRAKQDGRGIFRFFEGGMDARMQARRKMEIDLRRSLAFKELELVYQPQVRLESDSVVGFEALLRWNNPARGLVSPADFIPLAEEIGLIIPIGEWVLRTACAQAASWPEHVSIAVNVSPVQFRTGRLVEAVVSALANSGLDPSRLELEITEGALLENTERVLEALHAVRKLGVRISMDDFGTGYSSLSYLQKFPFDKIKIDQSFVRGMAENPDCRAIVRAVASLGASLGMKTTAEGVETHDQLAEIRSNGCSEVQGYFTGRPVSAADATQLLGSGETPEPSNGEA